MASLDVCPACLPSQVMDLQTFSGLKLKESVTTLETGGDSTAALHFSPFDPLLSCIDHFGVVRTYNTRHVEAGARPLNRFQAANGEDPLLGASFPAAARHRRSSGGNSPARSEGSAHDGGAGPPSGAFGGLMTADLEPAVDAAQTFQLNELHGSGLLGVCGSDGSVRLWRSHGAAGQQQLASAWQAAPRPPVLDAGLGGWWPCAFSLGAGGSTLFSCGGSHPRCINTWDLTRELCVDQAVVKLDPHQDQDGSIHLLSADRTQPLLALGCSGALVRLLDLRAPQSAGMQLRAHEASDPAGPLGSELVGLALRPSTSGAARLVTRSSHGPVKSIQAHAPTSGLLSSCVQAGVHRLQWTSSRQAGTPTSRPSTPSNAPPRVRPRTTSTTTRLSGDLTGPPLQYASEALLLVPARASSCVIQVSLWPSPALAW